MWVGPQIFLIFVFRPPLKLIPQAGLRRQVTEAIIARYNLLSWGSLVVLIITGLLNALNTISSWEALFATRYGILLAVKVLFVLAVLGLTALHTFYLGPRLLKFPPQVEESTDESLVKEYRRAQRQSLVVSSFNLLFSLLVLLMVALMRWG